MKILLIGGTGILSANIRDLAIERGHDVYILNRGINKVKNTNGKVKNIISDIRDREQANKDLHDFYFDVVVDFISFNIDELKNTLSIVQNKCHQFIFISSATVYRDTIAGEKITEDFETSNPDWEYAAHKIDCENYLKNNFTTTKMKYTIIRPYVTYSDARIPFAVIPPRSQWTLADRIKNKRPVILWDNGQAICTLTYSKDFAVGVVGLFANEKALNETFHITTDYTLTWAEALKYIAAALGENNVLAADIPSSYIARKMPGLKGELFGDKARNREFNNDKIKGAVKDFSARTTFQEGIKHTIQFYKKNAYMQEIDYSWNARVDKLILEYYKENGISNTMVISAIKNRDFMKSLNYKNRLVYTMSFYDGTYKLYTLAHRIKAKIRYTLQKRKSLKKGHSKGRDKNDSNT